MLKPAIVKRNIPWNKKEFIKISCLGCGSSFERWPSQEGRAKFCSQKCRYGFKRNLTDEHKNKIRLALLANPPWKGKKLPEWVLIKKRKPLGERARNWKGGISEKQFLVAKRRRARIAKNGGSFSSEEWETLKKDFDFRCLSCGEREPKIKLVPDHIRPVSKGGGESDFQYPAFVRAM